MTDAQAIAVVGAVAGTGGVSADGAASYTIPISLPPGTAGMQPSLVLAYDSQFGNGLAGYGWTVSGMSSIERCVRSIEDNGSTFGIIFNQNDGYCLDGQRLRLVSGSYGVDGSTYQTEITDFSVITAHVDSSATGGPSWFTVQTRDGRTYEYGNTTDSKILAKGTTVARAWALDLVTDANTNYMKYQYHPETADGDYWPINIYYSGNTALGTATDHQVHFDYTANAAGMIETRFMDGALISRTQHLADVKVMTNNAVTFTYTLSYHTYEDRYLLNQVSECGVAAGSVNTCLPPTTFTWQTPQLGWAADQATSGTIADLAHAQAAHLMDVDGDGIQDLVYPDVGTSHWYVMFGQPNGGFTAPVDSGEGWWGLYYACSLALDYNGDGRADLMTPKSGGWLLMVSTGSRQTGQMFRTPGNNLPDLSAINPVNNSPIYYQSTWASDFSGTGESDLVYTDGTNVYLRENSENFSTLHTVYPGAAVSRSTSPVYVDAGVDFEGAGRDGIIAKSSGSSPTMYALKSTTSLTYAQVGTASISSAIPSPSPIPFDANGDGQTDVLTNGVNGNWQISLGTGATLQNLSTSIATSWSSSIDPLISDFAGDGRQEVMVKTSASSWDTLWTGYTAGTGFSVTPTTAGTPYPANYGVGTLRIGNIEANGMDDLVYAMPNGDGTYTWHYSLHNGAPLLMTSATDGLGNVTTFVYCDLASGTTVDGRPAYTMGSGSTFPVRDVLRPMQIVYRMQQSDGLADGRSYNIDYTYSGGKTDVHGHGFLGFAQRTILDSRTGNIETLTYEQTFPYVGMVTEDDVVTGSAADSAYSPAIPASTPLKQVQQALDQIDIGSGYSSIYYPFVTQTVSHVDDLVAGVVQEVRLTTASIAKTDIDGFGNADHTTTSDEDDSNPASPSTFTTDVVTQYAPAAGTTYCVSLPQTMTVTRTTPDGSSLSRSTQFTPNTTQCQQSSAMRTPGTAPGSGSPALTTGYQYDGYGNVDQIQVSGDGLPTRTVTANNLGAAGEFPVSEGKVVSGTLTLASGHTWYYDIGKKNTDVDPNGNLTTYGYDGLGRQTSVTRADGSKTTWTYAACSADGPFCPATAAYEVTETQYGAVSGSFMSGYTAYDIKNRVVEQGRTLTGGVISRVDTTYDVLGNAVQVSKPYITAPSSPLQDCNTYDAVFDRLVSVATPQDDADTGCSTKDTVAYTYSGDTTSVTHTVEDSASTSASQTTYSTVDAVGQTVSTQDADGYMTSYVYDAFGNLTKTTDPDGQAIVVTYDGLGHKTQMVDPNLGTIDYSVDALGEVLCQTDAKGQSIIKSYDGVGRVISKLETAAGAGCNASSGTSSAWTYDTQTKGAGLPASVTDSNGFERDYDYDSLSRVADVTTTPGAGASQYTVSTTYDDFGRIQTVTYPVSVTPTTTGVGPTAVAAITAGPVTVGTMVTLDGSGSTPTGANLQYQWVQAGGPILAVGAFDSAGETTSFTPTIGGAYSFQLQVIDSNSALSAPASVSVAVKPLAPTQAPAITSTTPSTNGSVALSWSGMLNVDSYNVYKSSDNVNFTLAQNVSGTTATITGLGDGTYYFAIGAVAGGVNGDYGPSTSLLVTLPPGVPTSLNVNVSAILPNHTYTISWVKPGYGIETKYVVAEDDNSGFTSPTYITVWGSGSNPPATSLSRGKSGTGTYYYRVQACDQNACNNFSNADSVQVENVPSAPTLSASPTTVVQGDSTTLSWAPNSSPVTSYVVQWSSASNFSPATQLYSGSATSRSVVMTKKLYFRVQACDGVGCSGWSNSVSVNTSPGGGGGGCPPPPEQCQLVLNDGIASTQIVAPALDGDALLLPIEETAASPVALRAVAASFPPNAGPDVLLALASRRQELLGHEHLQPVESGLQTRFDRLHGAMPQALAMTRGDAPIAVGLHAGTPAYAPPVYQAYAGSAVKAVAATPYRFTVQSNYDPASGELLSVSNADTGFIYWRAATDSGNAPVDAFGHIVAYVDGNNVSTVSSYDQATGVVTGISTGLGQSTAIQQLAYSWDGFGNLRSRCDANRGLTETLQYEGVNRLSRSTVNTGASNCAGGNPQATLGMGYDAMGNIETRTNTGITVGSGTLNDSYTYGDPSHPYAVTGVTSIPGTYSYDANGNMLSGDGRTISWNDDNLPVSITSTGTQDGNLVVTGSSTFAYGPDKQRYSQTTTDSVAGNSSTTYVGGLFEVVTTSSSTQYRHNIMAGDQVVAVHTLDQSGNATTSYVHTDNLGSGDAITDDTGNIAVDPVTGQPQVMSFDAFGLRRDPNSWAYDLTGTQVSGLKAETDRGYTSQEQLDNVGLVHMNGRVYDPGIGRFISADPVVPGNRYAYLDNNPLNDTDPTGYCGGLFGGSCFGSSSPLNPITGPVNVLKQGASTVKHGLASLNRDFRDVADDGFRFAAWGFDMQRSIAGDYTRGVKTWTRNSINFAVNPAMNIEYSVPGLGNEFNVRMSHSKSLQQVGTVVAAVFSDIWGPEISAGYDAYLGALNGDSDRDLVEIGARETVEGLAEDEAINYAEGSDYAKSFEADYLPDWATNMINSKTTFSYGSLLKDFGKHYAWDNRIRLGHVLQDNAQSLLFGFACSTSCDGGSGY
ncbi:MAG TPA: RHS repeat-associated core domain-containing protein [Gammaproteobacteria bacterium]